MFSGLPVRTRVRTELAAERHLPGRECGIMASSADLIVPATPRTTMGAGPRLRSTARLENSLLDAILRSSSLATFKRSLKIDFYTQCF